MKKLYSLCYYTALCSLEGILLLAGLTSCFKEIPKPATNAYGVSTGKTNSVITLAGTDIGAAYKGTSSAGALGYLSVWEYKTVNGICTLQVTSNIRPGVGIRNISFKPFPPDSVNFSILKDGNYYSVKSGKVLVQDAGAGGRKFTIKDVEYTFRAVKEGYDSPGPKMDDAVLTATLQER